MRSSSVRQGPCADGNAEVPASTCSVDASLTGKIVIGRPSLPSALAHLLYHALLPDNGV